jgi:glutaminase
MATVNPVHVSTGSLPPPEGVAALLEEAHARYRGVAEGHNSTVYPALAAVDPGLFGICLAGTGGRLYEVGDTTHPFTLMSVSKPFVFALVCEALGPEEATARIGGNATGLPFNSLAAVERGPGGRTNPMVNAGAIATTALVPGADATQRWARIHDGLSRFAGHTLEIDDEVYASASATNGRNRSIARLLHSMGALDADPEEVVDLYTRQCSLRVTARDLAVMGATLAGGGVQPVTGARVVAPVVCHHVLAAMITAGLYETSGDWLHAVGLPGKSGISGGILATSPGKGGLGAFAPPLDEAGNSVRGQLAARYLSTALGLDMLASVPGRDPRAGPPG